MKLKFFVGILVIAVLILGLLVAGLEVERSNNWAPRELVTANIQSKAATISFYTNESVKSCVILFSLLSLPKTICDTQSNYLHYLRIENLSNQKQYLMLVWQNFLPFPFYGQKEIIAPVLGDTIPVAENLNKPETKWRWQKLPILKLAVQDEDKEPMITKGQVLGYSATRTVVYFTNVSTGDILSTPTNWQGNFIIDLKTLMPAEYLNVVARNEKGEYSVTLAVSDIQKGDLQLVIE